MIVSRARAATLACWILTLLAPLTIARAERPPIRELAIAFLDRNGDAQYQASAGYAGLYRPEHFSPFAAAELAIKDGAASASARGLMLLLLLRSFSAEEDAAAALRLLLQSNAVMAAIIDLPHQDMVQLAKMV